MKLRAPSSPAHLARQLLRHSVWGPDRCGRRRRAGRDSSLSSNFGCWTQPDTALPRSMGRCGLRHSACHNLYKVKNKIQKSGQHPPCFDYSGNFGRAICVLTPRNWPRNVHLRAAKMRLCGFTLEILYAHLKNSKWAICNVHLKVTGWFKTDATCEALLKFLSNLSKFICAHLHFVTAELAILHNYKIFTHKRN
jgi:hypothetical protein